MGKKRNRSSVARLPSKDHHATVFGNLVIAQQSPVDNNRCFSYDLFAPSNRSAPVRQTSADETTKNNGDVAPSIGNPRQTSADETTNNNGDVAPPLGNPRQTSADGDFDARQARNRIVRRHTTTEAYVTQEDPPTNQKHLRRSYSDESAAVIIKPILRHSPVLRKNPNYGRRSPSSCSSPPSSLRSSSVHTDDDNSPRRSPSISRGSSIEEEGSSVLSDDVDDADVVGKRRVSFLVDELLYDIYEKDAVVEGGGVATPRRRRNSNSSAHESDGSTVTSAAVSCRFAELRGRTPFSVNVQRARLNNKGVEELRTVLRALRYHVQYVGALLVKELKRREANVSRRDKQYDVITAFLQAHSEKRSEDTRMRFSAMPHPGDSGFTQWHDAMKMVARLPGGIPPEFRRRLWLTLAEKHLQSRSVDWSHAERFCFNEWTNPDDDELGIQIVKDLHRTGCSLFCGVAAQQNQALLKRVLLAFARWNKAVGYCQGFNMLAAIILQVCDRSDTDALKVMIYLIEGVLPESYFANNLRGLSVDMAVFRDLLRLRLPSLSRHLEQLQHDARDTVTGTSYEPPLTNVFTMQWFLTLFSNCLPQSTVLRVWDLIFLEGNEVLLRTALAIWDTLADRIMAVDSADEFYSIMGVLTREMLEFGLMDTNNLIKAVVRLSLPELPDLRDKYLYNITPWSHTVSNAARRGLRLFHSDDEEETDEDDEKMAVAAAYGLFRSPRQRDSAHRDSLSSFPFAPDRERLALDISALKQQYSKLRERQRQAHIILTAACARQPLSNPSTGQVAMNHLLLGKSALMSVRGRRGAPQGAVPPPAIKAAKGRKENKQLAAAKQSKLVVPHAEAGGSHTKTPGETLHWKDASSKKRLRRLSIAGECSVVVPPLDSTPGPELEEQPDVEDVATAAAATAVAEDEDDNEDGSSTSTELCDEPDRLSDFDSEEPTSVSEASSYNIGTIDEKHRMTSPPLISPVYEEEGPSCSLRPDVADNPPMSPSSGETSSYNLASSKTTSFSRSPVECASPRDDDDVTRTLARNETDCSLMKLDDDDDECDVTVNVEETTNPDEVDLIQMTEDVDDEDLDESFEDFVVERRKSTTTPVEFETDAADEDVVEIERESGYDDNREVVTEDIFKELVSQLSSDLNAITVPCTRPAIVEDSTLPTFVCELVEDIETILDVPVEVLSVDEEKSPEKEISMPEINLPEMVVEDPVKEQESDLVKTENDGGDLEAATVDETEDNYLQDGDSKTALEYLDVGPKFNIGRRHSERAMQIIHENNLILQNISQLQARRPSDLPGDVTKRRSMIGLMGHETRLSAEEVLEEVTKGESGEELNVQRPSDLISDVSKRRSMIGLLGHETRLSAEEVLEEVTKGESGEELIRPSDLTSNVTKRRSMIGVLGQVSRLSAEEVLEEVSKGESAEKLSVQRPSDLASDVTKRRSMIGLLGHECRLSAEEVLKEITKEGELNVNVLDDLILHSSVNKTEGVFQDPISRSADDLLEGNLNAKDEIIDRDAVKPTTSVLPEQISRTVGDLMEEDLKAVDGVLVRELHKVKDDDLQLLPIDDLLECDSSLHNSDHLLEDWPSEHSVNIHIEQDLSSVPDSKLSEVIDIVNREKDLDESPGFELGKVVSVESKILIAEEKEVSVGEDLKRVDSSTMYIKESPLVGQVSEPSESAKVSFQHARRPPYTRSVDVISEGELLASIGEPNIDRNVSLNSTDIKSADDESLLKSNDDSSHAYKPYYYHFNDSYSKRRSISLDETDSSKGSNSYSNSTNIKKETDRLMYRPERSKIFLPLNLSSGLESQLSPILSKSTEVLSPVTKVSEVAALSKSHDDLSPVTFRFKSFPVDRSPGPGAEGSSSSSRTVRSQRYSWACYENDKIYASGDAKMSPMTSSEETSTSLLPPYGVARSNNDRLESGSGEWSLEMTKTAMKMKKIFSPLTATPGTPPTNKPYEFPKPPDVKRDTNESPLEEKPLKVSTGDASMDYSLPSRSETTFTSSEKTSFETSSSTYSAYKFPKTDLKTIGLEDVPCRSSPTTSTSYKHHPPTVNTSKMVDDVGEMTSSSPGVFLAAFPKSPMRSPTKTFDPFPTRVSVRTKPSEVAVKLGLYATPTETKTKMDPDTS